MSSKVRDQATDISRRAAIGANDRAGDRMTNTDDRVVMSDLNSWAEYGLGLPEANGKLAIVGLTWGGGAAFRYGDFPGHNKGLKAVYIFCALGPCHPGTSPEEFDKLGVVPPLSVASMDVPVYGFYGAADSRVLMTIPPTKKVMAAAGKKFDYVVYKGAEHAFLRIGEDPNDRNPANAAADKASLARLEKLLKIAFK